MYPGRDGRFLLQNRQQDPRVDLAQTRISPERRRVQPGCGTARQYLAGCAERCHQIDLKNQELARLLAATNNVSPEIEKALGEAAQLRAQCQSQMLAHFYTVSRTMPPEQSQRYLAWVQSQTLLRDTHSGMHQ